MRRLAPIAALMVTASIVVAPVPASGGPTGTGVASENVEHLENRPEFHGAVGGILIGKHFYMNDTTRIVIFDVSDPLDPTMTGSVLMPQEWHLGREDIDGNGKILVVPNESDVSDGAAPQQSPDVPGCGPGTCQTGSAYIIDVEDKTSPRIIGKVGGGDQHTLTCILRCRWAYGTEGAIIDLRDPTNPKMAPERLEIQGHDFEEVAPGLVFSASMPMYLLDARKDPLHPKVIAKAGDLSEYQYQHGIRWPRRMKDRFLLAASEGGQRRCEDSGSGSFQTWDAASWKKTKTFTKIDEYRTTNGMFVDGNPAGGYYCSAHWFDEHPDFRNGGFVAAAFYDHGTRFLEVSPDGEIEEVGYFMGYGGSTSASYWITDEIVYAVDYHRGLDILRFDAQS